jgi:hypothetical protein
VPGLRKGRLAASSAERCSGGAEGFIVKKENHPFIPSLLEEGDFEKTKHLLKLSLRSNLSYYIL